MKAPCYKCTREEKSITCHATCPLFIKFDKDRKIFLEKKRKAKELDILDRNRVQKMRGRS